MRHIVALTNDPEQGLFVACSDGTIWFQTADLIPAHDGLDGKRVGISWKNHRWEQVKQGPIPGTAADSLCLAQSQHNPPAFCAFAPQHEGTHSWEGAVP